jgi:hypothetical protein
MSEPDRISSAPARKRAAKLDAGKLGDVLAGKGQAVGAPVGAEQRGAAEAVPIPRQPILAPQPAETRRRGPKGISTSLEVPPYLMDNIAEYLRANGGHNMRTLLFTGLTKLGIHVAPEDLVPQRQRRSR